MSKNVMKARESEPRCNVRSKTYFLTFRITRCVEKRDDDGSDRCPTSKNVATTGQSESNVFFRGRRQWPQASQSADPGRGPAWGSGALPVYDSLVSEKYGLEE